MNDFGSYLNELAPYFLKISPKWAAVSLASAILLAIILWKKYGRKKTIAASFLLFYMLVVFSYTVLARENTGSYHYKLEIFWSYREILNGKKAYIEENFLNVLLLMPLGCIMPVLKDSWKMVVGIGFCFSTFIEVLQLVTMRGLFEFDDIFHNTLGVAIGYMIYRLMKNKHFSDSIHPWH